MRQREYQFGDQVTIHWPAWRDATGRTYPAHQYHGQPGRVTEVTDIRTGNQRLYVVEGVWGAFPWWGSELRPAEEEEEG